MVDGEPSEVRVETSIRLRIGEERVAAAVLVCARC